MDLKITKSFLGSSKTNPRNDIEQTMLKLIIKLTLKQEQKVVNEKKPNF